MSERPGASITENDPAIRENRQAAATKGENSALGAVGERTKSDKLEKLDRPWSAETMIDYILNNEWEKIHERRLEKKYGKSAWGSFKRFLSGDGESSFGKDGEITNSLWKESSRKIIRTLFNRETAVGGAVLGLIGFATGGWGVMASKSYWGSIAGGVIAETRSIIDGAERKARANLMIAERDHWIDLKRLALQYKENLDPDKRVEKLKEIADRLYGAGKDSLSERIRLAQKNLSDVLGNEANRKGVYKTIGGLIGLAEGLREAYNLSHPGADGSFSYEDGKTAFGGVETDFDGNLHSVVFDGNQWNYALNPADHISANAAANIVDKTGNIGHTMGIQAGSWASWYKPALIYGEAALKAGAVLASMKLAGKTGDTPGQETAEEKYQKTQDNLALKRVNETIEEGSLPPLNGPERLEHLTEPAAGQIFGIDGVHLNVADKDGDPIHWEDTWRYMYVEKAVTNTSNEQEMTVIFYKTEQDLRNSTAGEKYIIDTEVWRKIRNASIVKRPEQEINTEKRGQLNTTEIRNFYRDCERKELQFVSSPNPEKLKILVSPQGWPLPGTLKTNEIYAIERIDFDKNHAYLRNKTTGNDIYVDLLALRQVLTGLKMPETKDKEEKKEDPKKVELENARRILKARTGQSDPVTNSVWYVPAGATLSGKEVGTTNAATLDPESSYIVADYRPDDLLVVLRSATDPTKTPVEIKLQEFAPSPIITQDSKIQQIFRTRATSTPPQPVPPGNKITVGQNFNFTPLNAGFDLYRVVAIRPGEIEIAQVANIAKNTKPSTTKIPVDPISFAETCEYIG